MIKVHVVTLSTIKYLHTTLLPWLHVSY